jgi:hypothetical protein
VRDDGGIEKRSGFQRVFGKEIGADQQSPLFGEFLIRQKHPADLFKAFQKEFVDLVVSLREFGGDFVQQGTDPVFRKRHDSGDDPAHPLGILRAEWPQKNP